MPAHLLDDGLIGFLLLAARGLALLLAAGVRNIALVDVVWVHLVPLIVHETLSLYSVCGKVRVTYEKFSKIFCLVDRK